MHLQFYIMFGYFCNIVKNNHKDLKYLYYLFLDVVKRSKHSGDFRKTFSHSKFKSFH